MPTGLDFTGVGFGLGGQVWFSGTAKGGDRRGYGGRVVGSKVQLAQETDSGTWQSVAVVNGTAYVATGFGVQASTDGRAAGIQLFTDAWALVPTASGLAYVGDNHAGAFNGTSPTDFTSTAAVPSSRALASAYGSVWWPQATVNGPTTQLGHAGPDGVVSYTSLPAPGYDITTAAGALWVLTQHSALKISATGKVTAKKPLPSGTRGVAISGGAKSSLWVTAVTTAGAGRLLRLSV